MKGLLWHSVAPKLFVYQKTVKDGLKQYNFLCPKDWSEQCHLSIYPEYSDTIIAKVAQFSAGHQTTLRLFSKSGRQNWLEILQQTEEGWQNNWDQ